MKKILPLVFALAFGCTIPQYREQCAIPEYKEPIRSHQKSIYTEAQVSLGPRPESLQNGYWISRFSKGAMTTMAGVYAGTVKVQKAQNGAMVRTICSGQYSQFEHPEAMDRVCRDADLDDDHILTDEEVIALARKTLR